MENSSTGQKKLLPRQKVTLQELRYRIYYVTGYLKLPIEVIVRRNFGRQYFHTLMFITGAVVMLTKFRLLRFIYAASDWDRFVYEWVKLVQADYTWYFYTFLYIGFGLLRIREVYFIPQQPGKTSLEDGEPFPFFKSEKWAGIIYEPLFFLCLGITLSVINLETSLDTLLIVCSLGYAWNNLIAYRLGETEIDDLKDQQVTGHDIAEKVTPKEEQPQYGQDGFVVEKTVSDDDISEVK